LPLFRFIGEIIIDGEKTGTVWKKWLDKEILLFEEQSKISDSSTVSIFYRLPEKIRQEASSDL
jgi:hypothetical protein